MSKFRSLFVVRRASAAALGLALGAFPGAAVSAFAQTAGSQPPSSAPAAAQVVSISEAVRAYSNGDNETAARLFQEILSGGNGQFELIAHYYLGLIDLERGLTSAAGVTTQSELNDLRDEVATAQLEGRSEDAKATQARLDKLREESPKSAAEAKSAFNSARMHLERVSDLLDPADTSRLELLRSSLFLGIAQLASDAGDDLPPAERERLVLDLSRKAEQTLTRFVASEFGRDDRYGHFYLAVARYRLAAEYSKSASSAGDAGAAISGAESNLKTARTIAEGEKSRGVLTENELTKWKATLAYYEALLSIQKRDYDAASRQFDGVLQALPADDKTIRPPAERIKRKLDEAVVGSPEPIRIPVPEPVGPFEFDGRLTIGNGFDSNVILQGRDSDLPRTVKRRDDYFFGLGADFNVSRYFNEIDLHGIGKSLTVGIGGYTAHQWQPNISEYDVNRWGGRAFINWQPIRDLYVGLQYDYTTTSLDRSAFVDSSRLTPSLFKIWRRAEGGRLDPRDTELARTDVYFIADHRNYYDQYRDNRLDRDGDYQQIGVLQRFNLLQARQYLGDWVRSLPATQARIFGGDWLYFQIGYAYRNERTRGTEFDLYSHGFSAGVYVPLPYRFTFELTAEFSWDNYGRSSIFDFERKERFDFVQRYDLGITYVIIGRGEYAAMRTLEMKVRGGIQMTLQNSNIWDRLGQDIYEYDREIYGIGLEIRF